MTTAVTVTQLRNLADRAAGGLTPDEQQRLRDGIDQLASATDGELRRQLADMIRALGASETENAELRARIKTLEHVAAGNKRHVQLIVPDLERAEATIARVQALADEYPAGIDTALIHAALDGQPGPAATQATEHVYLSTGCFHGDHAYCQSMTGLNGAKRPGVCKFCQASCWCGCHTDEEQPGPS